MFSINNSLTLSTVTVTNDLYAARNTLTHRILGPTSSSTIVLDYRNTKDGDRASLALFRDTNAWIGVRKDGGTFSVSFWTGLTMTSTWSTANVGAESSGAAISGGKFWLRFSADIHPGT